MTLSGININKYLLLGILVLISFFMHWPHFQKDLVSLHVWRQVETQTTILNFYEEDFNILNPRRNNRGDGDGIFRMEFPLMQWLVAGIYRIFGNHLIITRLFMFLTGLFTVAGIYELVFRIFNRKLPALIAAWTFNFSPGFYYYTINPMPDNFALCCSVWGLALFFLWVRKGNIYSLTAGGVLLSLGALSKLPFIMYFAVPWMYFILLIRRKESAAIRPVHLFAVLLPVILPIAWYAAVIPRWTGNLVVRGILGSDVPLLTVLDYLQHNLISTLPEILLGYGSLLFFLAGFYFLFRSKAYRKEWFSVFFVWGLAALVYFLFELTAIGKVHDYYLFPFFPLLYIPVGYGAEKLITANRVWLKYLSMALILAAPFVCYARMQGRWDTGSPGFNVNLLTFKQELREVVPHDTLCVAGNDESYRIFLYYIDKKGWTFTGDNLEADQLKEMIDRGARYLYSDSRAIDEDPKISPFLDQLVLEKGTIRVYSLMTGPVHPERSPEN